MTTHVAFLRAVNVAGHGIVKMADLCELATGLGLTNVRTLLQSGNVLFDARSRTTAQLESLLESAAAKQLGLETAFFVRTAAEWSAACEANPFTEEAERDPGRLLLMPLKDEPTHASVKALQDAITGCEVVRVHGRHAYLVYPEGVGRSKLTTKLIEKKFGTRGTGRNWNTVLKVAAQLRG